MRLHREMIISDLLNEYPEAAEILMEFGMPCVGCAASSGESLEEAAAVHGLDLSALMTALEKMIG